MVCIERTRGRVSLRMEFVPMGADACVVLCGGDRPHLGAAAVAQARPSLAAEGEVSASVSNITLPGHKEDELARRTAAKIAAALSANVAVCCGIHMDDISLAEIRAIEEMAAEMTDALIAAARADRAVTNGN